MREINSEETQRLVRIRKAHNSGPKSTVESRVALIAAERGITQKQLAKYYEQRRKDWKPRFDYWRFAKDHDISTDWLFDGDIRSYPVARPLLRNLRPSQSAGRGRAGGKCRSDTRGLPASIRGSQRRSAKYPTSIRRSSKPRCASSTRRTTLVNACVHASSLIRCCGNLWKCG